MMGGPAQRFRPDEPRTCPNCQRFLDAEQFFVANRNADGSVSRRHTNCRDCAREYQREYNRTHRIEDQERRKREKEYRQAREEQDRLKREDARRRSRKHRDAIRADPVRAAKYRAWDRERKRRRRERAKVDEVVAAAIRDSKQRAYAKVRSDPEKVRQIRETHRMRYHYERGYKSPIAWIDDGWRPGWGSVVDAAPFLDYLADTFPTASTEQLEALTGIDARRYIDLRSGQAVVSLGLVDRALTKGLGRPDLVAVLYPVEP